MSTNLSLDILESARTQNGENLKNLMERGPVLAVFLRYLGCIFCRETLSDISIKRKNIESKGVQVVLVHLSDNELAGEEFKRYGLEDLPRVSDPERLLYRFFELKRGTMSEIFSLNVWIRGLQALNAGHRQGVPKRGFTQFAGAFLLFKGRVLRAFRHVNPCDHPDYVDMLNEVTNCQVKSDSPVSSVGGEKVKQNA